MDSPEFSKIKANTASSSDSPPVQESPVFSYLNNLSPIKQAKATHVAQGFAGLSSPPLVFTSPRINSHREASFLRRPQIAQLFSAEKLKTQDEDKKHINQSHMGLITDTREHETIICRESEGCSSSEGVDEYLADPTEVECSSSAQSVNPCLNETDNDAKQLIGSKEITLFDSKSDTGTDSGMRAEPALITSEHNKDLERMQTFDAMPMKIKGQTADELPNVESGLSVDNAFKREYHQDLLDQDVGGSHLDDCDHTSQSPTGNSQTAQRYEDCVENVGVISKGMIGNMILHDPKAKSDQCGMHRRCLQFEETPPCVTGKGESTLGPREKVNNSEPHPGTADSEMVKSSYADLKATAKRQVGTALPPRSPLSVSKPSGIGLHLNSIVKVAPGVRGSGTSIKLDNYVGVKVMNSASIMSCHLPENVSPTLLIEAENYSAGAEESNEIENSISANSAITQSQRTVEFEHNGPPHEKRKFDSPSVDSYNEFSQSILKEKRKRTSRSKESDGCKRCNCKRSKCLKLYCDCFAAGVYCVESCTCQGCFNKPIYEDTVLETRQQIESRNPLAFAPKIVQTEEEIQFTPSSGRHKRGCNCKKSMCLKKYCECYQANVGCSSGCRCEGCENVHGRKGDYNPVEHAITKDTVSKVSQGRIDSTFEEKLEMVATEKDTLSTELYDSHNLTPLTPSFQCSELANNVPKSLCLPTTYGPSPESGLTNISSYEKLTLYPPRNAENGDSTLESSKELSDMASCDWRVDYENNRIVDTLSPTYNAAPTTCHTSPMSDVRSMAMASSTSSRRSDLTNASEAQLCHGSLSSGSSLQWHTSPVTPITRLGATKSFQGIDSESGPYDPLQDDTPEILKDTSSPVKTLKVSSPNKKRVSPPHSHIRALCASSSGALKSGRKFILKAVPSFPPLTPCIDSKGSSITQNTSNLQDKGLNK